MAHLPAVPSSRSPPLNFRLSVRLPSPLLLQRRRLFPRWISVVYGSFPLLVVEESLPACPHPRRECSRRKRSGSFRAFSVNQKRAHHNYNIVLNVYSLILYFYYFLHDKCKSACITPMILRVSKLHNNERNVRLEETEKQMLQRERQRENSYVTHRMTLQDMQRTGIYLQDVKEGLVCVIPYVQVKVFLNRPKPEK